MNRGWGISETISNIRKTCNWHPERKQIAAEKISETMLAKNFLNLMKNDWSTGPKGTANPKEDKYKSYLGTHKLLKPKKQRENA